LTSDTKASGQNSGRHAPSWPLVLSVAVHLTLLLLPLPRGQLIGRSLDRPNSLPNRLPLTVGFRVESGDTVPAIVLSKLAGDDQSTETVPVAPATKAIDQNISTSPASGDAMVSEPSGYLPPEHLTRHPEIRDMGNLDLPGVVRPGDNGRLILEILITDTGRPDSIRVVETSVPAPFLANAIRVFQWANYEPGRELNRAVRSRIRVEIVLGAQPTDARPIAPQPQSSAQKTERLYILPHK